MKKYDGTLIEKKFCYNYFKKNTLPIGNILAWLSPINIQSIDSIYSKPISIKRAINFAWEIPNMDSFASVTYLRLLNTNIANIIGHVLKVPVSVEDSHITIHKEHDADGIVMPKGIVNISLTHSYNNTCLGHTGLILDNEDTGLANTIKLGVDGDVVKSLITSVIDQFYGLNESIFLESSKL